MALRFNQNFTKIDNRGKLMKKSITKVLIIGVLAVMLGALGWLIADKISKDTAQVSAITREGVVTEVQKLSQLTSVAFSVDTVITAQKSGTWQRLWQDEQKGLFVAKGRVLAGVDLSKIGTEMVQVRHDIGVDGVPMTHIDITLPPSEVFEVYLDDIQVYDWQTGLFGMVDNDPQILSQAQTQGKLEVLEKACQGEVMTLALNNASEQVAGLFLLTGATVSVHNQGTGACQLSKM